MHPLIREAFNITKELGPVTFVGAVAVFLHTKNTRESRDLDFVIAKQITREELLNKDYKFITENGKEKTYTPRNYKIDIYVDRPLNRIPIETIIKTSQDFPIDKKGNTVNAMGLEALILAKFRANRQEQDYPDLRGLAIQRFSDINWKEMEKLVDDATEVEDIRSTLKYIAKN
ncbi:MAG: hypothetical protein IH841_08045 [Thaumarchaeota archaeon]|nr:hypothetical protein [Nitrososphaerota archaeon]